MGKLEQIIADIAALPDDQREVLLTRIEALLEDAATPGNSVLSDAQVAELRRRRSELGDLATAEEVETFFSRFRS